MITEQVLASLKFILSNLKPVTRAKGNSKSSIDERLKMITCFVNVSYGVFTNIIIPLKCFKAVFL